MTFSRELVFSPLKNGVLGPGRPLPVVIGGGLGGVLRAGGARGGTADSERAPHTTYIAIAAKIGVLEQNILKLFWKFFSPEPDPRPGSGPSESAQNCKNYEGWKCPNRPSFG